jgi:ubiquitin-protein ligase E3 D
MPKPKIILYAETLTHIRQLTLHASLQTEKNEHTKILISSDKKIITALHDGEAASIYLPTQISGTAHVTFPIERRTEISTRLQIDDEGQLDSTKEESCGVEVPWSAASLQEDSSLYCGQCDADIFPAVQSVTWKDLPSENWEELMDFWYCHKPHDHEPPLENSASEIPSSNPSSKPTASSGVGLIDTISFLLWKGDCTNIGVSRNRRFACFVPNPLFANRRQERSFSGFRTRAH